MTGPRIARGQENHAVLVKPASENGLLGPKGSKRMQLWVKKDVALVKACVTSL